jgi:hypothetical protein
MAPSIEYHKNIAGDITIAAAKLSSVAAVMYWLDESFLIAARAARCLSGSLDTAMA